MSKEGQRVRKLFNYGRPRGSGQWAWPVPLMDVPSKLRVEREGHGDRETNEWIEAHSSVLRVELTFSISAKVLALTLLS